MTSAATKLRITETAPQPYRKIWPVGQRLRLRDGEKPRFLLTVDTEEEFDWSAPFDRNNTSTRTIEQMHNLAGGFKICGIKGVFLCDWPVMNNPESAKHMKEIYDRGFIEIGAHLHPWVTPPHDEEVTTFNSFAGNLPADLERKKLTLLTEKITEVIGKPPIVFRAGRYGLGPSTHQTLADLGYRFDTSIRSGFDYSDEGGPDFSGYPIHPWKTPEGLIEVPLSTTQIGWLRKLPPMNLPGSSRLRLQSRVPLTPEGTPVDEALEAIRHMHKEGQQVFCVSLHSPTMVLGHTPYVRTAADKQKFWEWLGKVITEFDKLGVLPTTYEDLLPLLSNED